MALLVLQCFVALFFLTHFLLGMREHHVKDAPWIRLLAFHRMAVGTPAVWNLAVWCGLAFIP